MGMITKRKGAYDLIDSIKLIDKDLPKEITIILCGFDEENKAKEYARNLNLNHRIIFPGWIDKEKKNEFYKILVYVFCHRILKVYL